MGLFSNSTEKSAMAQNPVNPDITKQYGSGAEQDRYGSHFSTSTSDIGQSINQGVDKVKEAALTKGEGAEQDKYQTHFSPAAHGTDAHSVQQATQSLIDKASGSAKTSSSFGLGFDGQQRAGLLAGGNGSGAEQFLTCLQDQYGGHFGLDRESVEGAAKRVQDGAHNILNKK
ncbi:hypothetical protein GQ44DRAFT_624618 [Phaeosphaeriaceae sp. PMI808]|nr:hypothetical protein GQ44DRAFT_624618 [Phaeosphaeriaceae sp. PMI808]